ncbi:MAG: nucleotidyltransferase domain-containing protein, partial [Candidatus Nanoarchaeia archaeon]|nr:nucleotidyltransferase domain-containing protein [Candidatus Nanoarchaeia archaeon]
SFNEIKKLSKKKSESYAFNTIKKLVDLELLSKKKIGNSMIYKLNINSLKSQSIIGFLAENHAFNKLKEQMAIINNLAKKIPTLFFSLIITGSYAKNMQKNNSDLDLVIITDNSIESKKIYSEINHYSQISIPKIHPQVFKESEFKQMLLEKSANFGKETAKNNLIIFGAQNYYKLLNEVLNNGFNG